MLIKLGLFIIVLAVSALAQYFPPLGGGSSGGNVTVNGTTCTIGSSCTVTGAPSGAAGGALTGTYPNPTIANLTTVGAIPYVSASGVLNQAGALIVANPGLANEIWTFRNLIPTTGATLVTITKGAGQTASTNTLVSDASASFVGAVSASGAIQGGSLESMANTKTAAAGYFYWTARSGMDSPSDGIIRMSNAAVTDFNRLQFGGTTSSFPSWKRSTVELQARLADDSAHTDVSMRHALAAGPAPALGGACSTAASGTLTDESGRITTTTTGTCTFTVTFGTAYTTDAPSCSVFNETTANLARPTATTAVLTGVVTTISGDSLVYQCKGHKP